MASYTVMRYFRILVVAEDANRAEKVVEGVTHCSETVLRQGIGQLANEKAMLIGQGWEVERVRDGSFEVYEAKKEQTDG